MHKTAKHWLPILALIATDGLLFAQPPAPQPPLPAARQRSFQRGIPLNVEKDDATIQVSTNTTERFSVAPYKLYDTPRSTREDVATVQLVRPPGGEAPRELADSFSIQTSQLIGVTTIVLPLVKEGGTPIERRIEVLVVDEVSSAYKSYLESQIKTLFPTVSVDVLIANAQTAVLTGFVDRAELVEPVERFVRGFLAARTGAAPDTVTVVNALRVTGAQQVQLKVVIAEVNRTKTRDFGFEWAWQDLSAPLTGGLVNFLGVNISDARQLITGDSALGRQSFVLNRAGVYQFNGFLRALIANQLAKILAEPVLVTMSGQPAYFNAGGQVPLITPQQGGGGAQGAAVFTITYRDFGTNLRFVPTVLGEGRVRLEVRPEVSRRNDANGIILNGTVIPGFDSRVAETTVELEAGQTFAIAGLIDQRVLASTTKTPILGDTPIIGWAFQNKAYRQEETELLILVTPHLVDALDQRPCKLPGRESRIPNDVEYFIGSKFEPPCFADPYRDHFQNHFNNVKPPAPQPVLPYDNYGLPPGVHPSTIQHRGHASAPAKKSEKGGVAAKTSVSPSALEPLDVPTLPMSETGGMVPPPPTEGMVAMPREVMEAAPAKPQAVIPMDDDASVMDLTEEDGWKKPLKR